MTKNKKGQTSPIKLERKGEYLIIPITVILFISIAVFLFFAEKDWTKEKIIENAIELRKTTVSLAQTEESRLDNYYSMLFANDLAIYDTCSNEITVDHRTHFSWTRDWLYLILFDSMHAEMKGDENLNEAKVLLDNLYEGIKIQGMEEDKEAILLYELAGHDNSWCLPAFILKNLENRNESTEYPISLDLAIKFCNDYYQPESSEEISVCEEEGRFTCISDEEFYSSLEKLLYEDSDRVIDKTDFSYYENYKQNVFAPTHMFPDKYMVGYTNDWEEFVKYTNARLLDAIEYMEYDIEFTSQFISECPCLNHSDFYSNLLKAMAIKKHYLEDIELLRRHEYLERALLSLCSKYYPSLYGILDTQKSLGDKIEFYYLYQQPEFEKTHLDNLITEAMNRELFLKKYNGEKYTFIEADVKGVNNNCLRMEMNLRDNLKTALYLLIYSIYGN